MSTNPLYNQLLERVFTEQPELAQYAELFNQMAESKEAPEEEDRLRKITSIAKRLRGDLEDAKDELYDFAKALGACHECWGEDDRCPICRGEGQSGYFKLNRELFDLLILPALKKANWLEVTEKQQG